MALRKPPPGVDALDARALAAFEASCAGSGVAWQSWRCTLVTPLYGGGVTAGEVDRDMPIRASALRGQLRFWWRLLARHKYALAGPALREREFQVWGGVGSQAQASKVWVKVTDPSEPDIERWAHYEPGKSLPSPEPWADAPYALFPAQGKKPGLPDSADPAALVRPGLQWTLQIGMSLQADADAALREELTSRVPEALRWWASFGGVGARTRRGLGAVQVDGMEPVGVEEAAQAGCRLVIAQQPRMSASDAWEIAVSKLQEFRQKPGLARNPGSSGARPGRSRWPEPDALRRLTGRHAPLHAPQHPAGNVFPRAAFGLPLVFQFKDKAAGDPGNPILMPEGFERLASPLVLRPYRAGNGRWFAAALLLPHAHVERMRLRLQGGAVAVPAQWWRPEVANQVPPMAGRGQDALSAFLSYFAGQAGSVA